MVSQDDGAKRRLVQQMDPSDNVATALADLAAGTRVQLPRQDGATGRPGEVVIRTPIPFGHKVALRAIRTGEAVRKYGEVIGLATTAIAPGEHVHVHNVESQRGRGDLAGHDAVPGAS